MQIGVAKLTASEHAAMAKAIESEAGVTYQVAKDCVLLSMGAFYRARFGVAPGTTAVRGQQTAMRYYDTAVKAYRWAMHSPPDEPQKTTYADELPAKAEWTIHEKVWWELIQP